MEDALAEVTGEEQGVGTTATEGSEESQSRNADVLRFVHDGEVERRVLGFGQHRRQGGEQTGMRGELPLLQSSAHPLEDGPQHRSLGLGQPGLATEPGDIAIRLPCFQLPGIHHLLPFGEEKMQIELVTAHRLRCFTDQVSHGVATGERHRPAVGFVETQAKRVEGMNVNAFRKARFAAHQAF